MAIGGASAVPFTTFNNETASIQCIANTPLAGGSQYNISKLNWSMISLLQQRTWFSFLTVDRAARNTGNFPVANDCHSIAHNGNHPANQRYIIRLPLSRSLRYHFRRGNEA